MPSSSAVPGPNSSAMAVKGIPTSGGNKRSSQQPGGHPYASTSGQQQGGYERNDSDYGGYRSSQVNATPVMSPTAGAGHGGGNQDYNNEEEHAKGFSLIRFLTCRCV